MTIYNESENKKSRTEYMRDYMRKRREQFKKEKPLKTNKDIGFTDLQIQQLKEIVFNEFIASIEAIDSILVRYEKQIDNDKEKIINLNERLKKHERI